MNELLTFAIMLRPAHGIVHTSHDNADRFKERTEVSVSAIGMKHTKNNGCECYIFIALEINILYRNACILSRNICTVRTVYIYICIPYRSICPLVA